MFLYHNDAYICMDLQRCWWRMLVANKQAREETNLNKPLQMPLICRLTSTWCKTVTGGRARENARNGTVTGHRPSAHLNRVAGSRSFPWRKKKVVLPPPSTQRAEKRFLFYFLYNRTHARTCRARTDVCMYVRMYIHTYGLCTDWRQRRAHACLVFSSILLLRISRTQVVARDGSKKNISFFFLMGVKGYS
jgi:hypothetical protein